MHKAAFETVRAGVPPQPGRKQTPRELQTGRAFVGHESRPPEEAAASLRPAVWVRDVPERIFQVAAVVAPQASASSCQQAAETQRKNVALPPAPAACLLSAGTKGGWALNRHGEKHGEIGSDSPGRRFKGLDLQGLFSDAVFLPDGSDCTRSVKALIPALLASPSVLLLSQPPVYKRLHCPPPVLLFSPGAASRRKHPQRFDTSVTTGRSDPCERSAERRPPL